MNSHYSPNDTPHLGSDAQNTSSTEKQFHSTTEQWSEPVWQLDHAPHAHAANHRVIWSKFRIARDHVLTDLEPSWIPPLLETMRHFASYLLHYRELGTLAPSTTIDRVRELCKFLQFITEKRECTSLNDVVMSDVEAFVTHRIAELRNGTTPPSHTGIARVYASVIDFSDARPFLQDQGAQHLSFQAWPGESPGQLAEKHAPSDRGYIFAVPSKAGKEIVNRCVEFIDAITLPTSRTLLRYYRAFNEDPNSKVKQRSVRSARALRSSFTQNFPKGSLQEDVARKAFEETQDPFNRARLYRSVSRLAADLVAASTIAIQALTGARISEVLQLRTDCVSRETSTDGRWYFYLLKINRDKTDDGWLNLFAGMCPTATPPPSHDDLASLEHPDRDLLPIPVRAVLAMRALREPARQSNLTSDKPVQFLFPRAPTNKLNWIDGKALTTYQATTLQNEFVARRPEIRTELMRAFEELALDLGLDEAPRNFTTHAWRKWFTEAVIAYDQFDEDYPSLQRQLGHVVGSLVTKTHYSSGGLEYRQLAENVFQERAARAMLRVIDRQTQATSNFPQSIIEDGEKILDGLPQHHVEKRVEAVHRYLQENGATLVAAGNNSGICAFRPDYAKCWDSVSPTPDLENPGVEYIPGRDWVSESSGAPIGPNRAVARASLCRTCANFMLTEDQTNYWVDAAEGLIRLAETIESSPTASTQDLYEAHAHRANATDYLGFVKRTLRRMEKSGIGGAG